MISIHAMVILLVGITFLFLALVVNVTTGTPYVPVVFGLAGAYALGMGTIMAAVDHAQSK